MREKIKEKRTLFELCTGIITFGIICQIALAIAASLTDSIGKRPVYYFVGLWIGIMGAIGYGFHMYHSLSIALGCDPDTAVKVVKKGSIIRYVSLVFILGGLMVIDVVSPLTAFLGVMGLKAGAYMQPLTYKILSKFIGEEERPPLLSPEEQDELYGKKKELPETSSTDENPKNN